MSFSSSPSISAASGTMRNTVTSTIPAHRPAVDTMVEKLALGMLRWSDHRAEAAAARPAKDRAPLPGFTPAGGRSVDSGRTARFF